MMKSQSDVLKWGLKPSTDRASNNLFVERRKRGAKITGALIRVAYFRGLYGTTTRILSSIKKIQPKSIGWISKNIYNLIIVIVITLIRSLR